MTDVLILIEQRLAAAAITVRAIPSSPEDLTEEAQGWPDCVLITLESARSDQAARRIAPTPEALDDMRVAIAWLGKLDPEEADLVWLRADGNPWRVVSQKTGCVRPKAWERWKAAIAKIARRAKVRAKATPPKPKADPASKKDQDQDEGNGSTEPLPLFVGVTVGLAGPADATTCNPDLGGGARNRGGLGGREAPTISVKDRPKRAKRGRRTIRAARPRSVQPAAPVPMPCPTGFGAADRGGSAGRRRGSTGFRRGRHPMTPRS